MTIAAGQSFIEIAVNAGDDTSAEGPEYATLELLPGTGYSIGGLQAATVTILDTDSALPVVSLEVVDADAEEAGGAATLKVSRTGATTNPLTVRYSVSGSAAAAADFASIGTQIVIPAGAAAAPLVITAVDDSANEGTESVTVTLATNAAYIRTTDGGATAGTINILDDDIATVSVTASDATATELDADTGTFVISRTGDTSQPLVVNYALSGTAHQGVDYLPVPGVLTIPAGSSVGSVTVTPIDDGIGEPQQTVFLQLRGATRYSVVTPSSATINITDNGDLPVVTVSVSDGTIGEPTSTGKFKFTTTGTGTGNITVNYTVTGTATPGVDYNTLAGTLSMGRNATAEVTVTPVNDSIREGFETVTVAIDPDPAYSTHFDTEATLNLTDDDQPMVSVSTTNDAFTESSGTGKFWLSRSGSTTASLVVNFTLGGTATNGSDYTTVGASATIPAGAAGFAVSIAPINDTSAEGTETVVLTLAAGSYGIGLPSATHYLSDNESPAVQVRFGSASGSGNENVGTVNVPVTLSAAAATPVTVECVINGGTATAGVDYSIDAVTLVFAPGETSKTLPLIVTDDIYDEPSQTILLKLQNANRAALGTSAFTYTINDNDSAPIPTIAFASSASSGAESISPAAIVVSLSAPQSTAVSVNFAPGTGTATDGEDFTLSAGTLSFAPGETAKIIPSTVINDGNLEPNETVSVSLSNPVGATLGAIASHTYTITDDDAATLSIAASDPSASESGDPATFTLTRSGNAANALVVSVSVSGSATESIDYEAITRNVPMSSGQTIATITLLPLNDASGEGNENVTITLGAGAGYTVGTPNAATAIIADDESSLSIAATDASAAEAGQEPGLFTISRSGNTASELLVNLSITGTATSGSDFQPITTPVVLAAGAASVAVAVTPVDDLAAEGPETVVATLNSGSGYFLAAPTAATMIIADDDLNNPPTVTLVSPSATQIGLPSGLGLVLEATANDDGKPNNPGVLTTTWSRVSGPGTVTFADAGQPNTTVTFSASGTYVLRFLANDGEFQSSLDLSVLVGGQPSWTNQNIGTGFLAGSFSQTNGTYVVRGSGANISGTSDGFHFAYQQLSGDGEIRARVVSMSGGASSAKAGVMIRNTTATNSRLAYMSLYGSTNTSDDSSFRVRTQDGATANTTSADGQNAPYWIRLVRAGNSFSGFASADGVAWTQIGSTQTVTMNAQVLIGLAVTSNNTATLCTATFDNLSISTWPGNVGADVDAGADFTVTLPSPATLAGSLSDDDKPEPPASVATAWSTVNGPGTVTFADASQLNTAATFAVAGTYVLRLTGDDGEVKTFDDVIASTSLPNVAVASSTPLATEYGPTAGMFTITRTGSTAFSLVVRFSISGSATSDADFNAPGNAVTLAIGESSATIDVTPLVDALREESETIVLTIEPDAAYVVGTSGTATVTVTDPPFDVWRREAFGIDAENPTISGDAVDLDGDGLPNLLEYALVGDPFGNGFERPIFAIEGGDCTLTYRRRNVAIDLVYAIEEFTEGNGWTSVPFNQEMLSETATLQTMKARVPVGSAADKVIRLRVTRN